MKVFLINAVNDFGSTGKICQDIAGALRKEGHLCYIFFGQGNPKNSFERKIISSFGIKLHAFMARIVGLQGYFSTLSAKRVIREVDRLSPDVVHIHNAHGNYINIVYLLKELKARRIKTFITLHDCWFFTGKCTHFQSKSCDRWKEACGNCPLLKQDIPSFFFDTTSRMLADKKRIYENFENLEIISVSRWIFKLAKQSVMKNNRHHLVYNWVDLSSFGKYAKQEKSEFVILGVSAIWEKGSDKLNDFVKLSRLLPENMKIKLIGRKNSDLNLPKNIEVLEYINDKETLAREYTEADVYVHFSREDSFGKVIVEALACGTPAIVYDVTACPELVGENCGKVVELGNVEAAYDAICEIHQNQVASYVEPCKEFAKRFSADILVQKTIDLYKK